MPRLRRKHVEYLNPTNATVGCDFAGTCTASWWLKLLGLIDLVSGIVETLGSGVSSPAKGTRVAGQSQCRWLFCTSTLCLFTVRLRSGRHLGGHRRVCWCARPQTEDRPFELMQPCQNMSRRATTSSGRSQNTRTSSRRPPSEASRWRPLPRCARVQEKPWPLQLMRVVCQAFYLRLGMNDPFNPTKKGEHVLVWAGSTSGAPFGLYLCAWADFLRCSRPICVRPDLKRGIIYMVRQVDL